MKILVTIPEGDLRNSFIPPQVVEVLNKTGDVEYNQMERNYTPEELKEKLTGKDAVITGWGTTKLDKSVLEGNDTLKLICHTGGTVSSIVDDYAYENGIIVTSGNNVYAESVAEAIIAYSLLGLRKIPKYLDVVHNNGWFNGLDVWEGLLDQTMGFVSFGTIPRYLIEMLKPFRVKVKVYSAHISDEELEKYGMEYASLEEIFSTCKIISVHSAYTEKTHHMINKKLLKLVQDGAVFINTSRGSVIDEEALIEELKKERFTAVLDVYEQEPMALDNPLRNMKNVYAIPHMGGPTYDRRKYVTLALIDDIKNYMEGRPLKMEITYNTSLRMTKQ